MSRTRVMPPKAGPFGPGGSGQNVSITSKVKSTFTDPSLRLCCPVPRHAAGRRCRNPPAGSPSARPDARLPIPVLLKGQGDNGPAAGFVVASAASARQLRHQGGWSGQSQPPQPHEVGRHCHDRARPPIPDVSRQSLPDERNSDLSDWRADAQSATSQGRVGPWPFVSPEWSPDRGSRPLTQVQPARWAIVRLGRGGGPPGPGA